MSYRFWVGIIQEEPGMMYKGIQMYKNKLCTFHNDWPSYMRSGGHKKILVF